MYTNPFVKRHDSHRDHDHEAGEFQTLPVRPRRGPHDMPFSPMPGEPGQDGIPHGGGHPRRPMPGQGDFGPEGPMPPRGGHHPHGGPESDGRFGPHGRPPRFNMPPQRLDSDFLKRRIEEADLGELIDMAGRMTHRRPAGGPAAHGQALILSILAGREDLSQRQLQQMLGIQPGSLSEILSKLEAKGYLTREKAEDRRGNLLRITEAGREAMLGQESAPADDRFNALTDEQQDQLSQLLRALLTDWATRLEQSPRRGPAPFLPEHGGDLRQV